MATIALTRLFGDLDDWPGRLLEADDSTTVATRTATRFTFAHGGDSPFEGFRVVVAGTGFGYLNGVPVRGTISQVRIVDDSGQTVLTVGGLAGGSPVANDLSQFFSNVFGSPFEDAGPDPDGGVAWSHLLSGNDVITGTAGDDEDRLPGFNAGNDTYNMGAGDDRMRGGVGADTYNGGAGHDEINFYETTFNQGGPALRGATVNVAARTILDPWGFTDRFTGVERFVGSRFNDTFLGAGGEDQFAGLRGRDVIDGGLNSFDRRGDRTDDEDDRASYRDDYWQGGRFGIVADLETSIANGSIRGTVRDGFGNLDTVVDIEDLEGTQFNDVLVGSRTDNAFIGGEGRDSFDGGAGFDRIEFYGFRGDPRTGIVVDMTRASGQIVNDGFGNAEDATGIEEVQGTDRADRIRMGAGENLIWGGFGGDTMAGGAGRDTFEFREQDELGAGDRITDFTATGQGRDILAFDVSQFDNMTTTLRLVNGTAAPTGQGTFLFNAANDTLFWDSNGNGAGGREAVAVLVGVNALSAANFELWD